MRGYDADQDFVATAIKLKNIFSQLELKGKTENVGKAKFLVLILYWKGN